jgi:SAM-dependent methyltransferase
MAVKLSHCAADGTGRFFTRLHRSVSENVKDFGLPPTALEFAVWFDGHFDHDVADLEVLDVGCGLNAYNARHASKRGCRRVCAVDLNPDAAANLRAVCPEIEVAEGSLLDIPHPDQSLDFVICSGAVHHAPDPEKALAEIHRILRPGGKAYISMYSFLGSPFEYIVRVWRFIGLFVPYSLAHSLFNRFPAINNYVLDHTYVPILWLFGRDEIVDLLRRVGFAVIDDWPNRVDPFQRYGFTRFISGGGLVRVFLVSK